MERKNWAALGLIAVAASAGSAFAADSDVPFQACKGVTLVDSGDTKTQDALKAKGCAFAIEYSTPGIGDNVKNSIAAAGISDMLSNVASEQYIPDLDKRIKYWQGVKKCFQNKSSSSACATQLNTITGAYGNFIGTLRRDLAQTELSKDGEPSSSLKAFGSGKYSFIPNGFPASVVSDLQSSELAAARAEAQQALKTASSSKVENAAQEKYGKDLAEGVQNEGLYLVEFLPKPSGADEGGNPTWQNGEWTSTIDKLIAEAEHEKQLTRDAVKRNVVSFPAFGVRDLWHIDPDERDLMYYATLGPEMEKYLSVHKSECGLAIAATKWMHKKEWEKIGANVAAMTVGGVGGGALFKFGELGRIGRTLSAVTALGGGWTGAAMTINDYQQTQAKAKTAFRQVAKIGAEKGKEEDVVDPKAYAEAQDAADHWLKNTATTNALMLGGLGAGGIAGHSLAKIFISKGPEVKAALSRLLLSSGKDADKVAAELEKSTPKKFLGTVRDNLAESGDAIVLAKKVGPDMQEIATDLKPEEVAQVEDVLIKAEPRVAEDLSLQGKCNSHEACIAAAADKEADALRDAKGVCKIGKK